MHPPEQGRRADCRDMPDAPAHMAAGAIDGVQHMQARPAPRHSRRQPGAGSADRSAVQLRRRRPGRPAGRPGARTAHGRRRRRARSGRMAPGADAAAFCPGDPRPRPAHAIARPDVPARPETGTLPGRDRTPQCIPAASDAYSRACRALPAYTLIPLPSLRSRSCLRRCCLAASWRVVCCGARYLSS